MIRTFHGRLKKLRRKIRMINGCPYVSKNRLSEILTIPEMLRFEKYYGGYRKFRSVRDRKKKIKYAYFWDVVTLLRGNNGKTDI